MDGEEAFMKGSASDPEGMEEETGGSKEQGPARNMKE